MVMQQTANHLLPQLKFLEKHPRRLWKTVDGMTMNLVIRLQRQRHHPATPLDLELGVPM
jgi:hypothetical protein